MESWIDDRRRTATRRFLSRVRYLRRVLRHQLETSAYGGDHSGIRSWHDLDARQRAGVRLRYRTRASCSCMGCGNPRRWFQAMSRQEFRAELSSEQQFDELGIRFKRSRFVRP